MPDLHWTAQQARAIRSTADTLLVANAGTGKTTTVVGKVLWLLGLPFGTVDAGQAEGPGGASVAEATNGAASASGAAEGEAASPLEPCPDPCQLREIAAITFTEKAAYDLKRQLRKAIEDSPRADELRWELDRASIGTIHSFCGELLREQALRLQLDPTFDVLDANETWAEQDALIKELLLERVEAGDEGAGRLVRQSGLADKQFQKGAVGLVRDVLHDLRWHAERHARWTAGGELSVEQLRRICPEWDDLDDPPVEVCRTLLRVAREAARRWRDFLEEENVRDFDSLILDARELLASERGRPALEAIRSRYRILIIDEFQDTDFAQRDIAFAIAGRPGNRPQLFLVGDPKQSIYRFRGADVSVWNEVEQALRDDGEVLELSRNFRSAPPIVEFVNEAASFAMRQTGESLAAELPDSRVRYAPLEAALADSPQAGVEWLVATGDRGADVRHAEARHVAARILELVGDLEIDDPDAGVRRPLQFRDVAVLYRTRTGLEHFETALTRHGIPYFLAGAPHLGERQEVVDVLNALQVIRSERDDLRAFGFLRSPFVGLRDESIARIRLLGPPGPLLRQAERFLDDGGELPPAPEHPDLPALERRALERGLSALRDLRELAPRLPLDELIEELLERTGYALHLLLLDRAEESLANLQTLVHFAEAHRHLDTASFLEVWERRNRQDVGLPQAPLYSKEDDVVTLSTIHGAKGLEWPVVFLVGVSNSVLKHRSNEYWTDRELGPVLAPKQADRGPRAERLHRREQLEGGAEEARLLYVATTRARDRLVVVGPRGKEWCYGEWLEEGLEGATLRHTPGDVTARSAAQPPDLAWLDRIETASPPPLVTALAEPPLRWFHSATELLTRADDPDAWERRYRHAVEASWEFAPAPPEPPDPAAASAADRLPAKVRGAVIHGVLERIERASELSRILDETIGGLDEPELERLMERGTPYREALEEEIRGVVESDEWHWYVEGEHWRELEFVHLRSERDWRQGALDLYRRLEDNEHAPGAEGRRADVTALIVDFKTHRISAEEAGNVAGDYELQVHIYRTAAQIVGPTEVRLHFTKPGEVVTVD